MLRRRHAPTKTVSWLVLTMVSLAPFVAVAGFVQTQPAARQKALPADASPAEENLIHTPAGFSGQGQPAVATGKQTGIVRLTIVDSATGQPTFARVNVVGADGNFYEPGDHPLAPWSLHRLGNRPGKGPIRYYGWFFYCSGEATVRVPAGPVRVEVSKGFEFRPQQHTIRIEAGTTQPVRVVLERTVPMAEQHYYSGDTHIHLPRRTADDDECALDLLAAEDVGIGYLLAFHQADTYSGIMSRQLIPQDRGFGPTSIKSRGNQVIASGQEYIARNYGHICLLMHKRLVQSDQTINTYNWPVLGLIGQETRQQGGYSFHAHGGYAQEIYVDFAQGATDGVELLQFAQYRGIGLRGWYRMLNSGYRFPALGACDYPYCRALADSRTYVHTSTRPGPADWIRLAAQGRSFFTTGPLLLLEVDGQPPGSSIVKTGKGPHAVKVRIRSRCEVAPVTHLELIVNGEPVQRREVARAAGQGQWMELNEVVNLTESSWLAARVASNASPEKRDAEAHTNPVYVYLDGKAPFRPGDLDWLVERVQEQINGAEKRRTPEQAQVLEYFRKSREELLRVRTAGGSQRRRAERRKASGEA